jgi:histone-lysine N-methyltransferase SETMAR
VFIIPSPTAWGKVFVKWIPHVLISDQRTMLVLAATHLQRRNTGSTFLIHILMVDGSWMLSFDPQLTWQNADWRAPTSLRKTTQHSQLAVKVMHIMFSSQNGLVLDHPMPNGVMVSGRYDCPLLQDKVRLALHHQQPELLEHGIILLLESATPHFHNDVQSRVQCWGREVLIHPSYSPGLTSYDYTGQQISKNFLYL